MSAPRIIRWLPVVSYILLAATLLSFLAFPVLNAISHGHTSGAYFFPIFAFAVAWQVFTVYHHRRRLLPWLLLAFYVFGLYVWAAS
jgi:hypothetical protein